MSRLRLLALGLLLIAAALAGCGGGGARSKWAFDEIRDKVAGRSAAEVEELLGAPDLRQPILLGDERWVWWDYTYLDGAVYAPEERGRVVHLEILFARPPASRSGGAGAAPPLSAWKISGPLGVSYVPAGR